MPAGRQGNVQAPVVRARREVSVAACVEACSERRTQPQPGGLECPYAGAPRALCSALVAAYVVAYVASGVA
jgi:hypothetical protein